MFKKNNKTHSIVHWLIYSLLPWNKGFAILTLIHFSYTRKQETWSLLLKTLLMFGNFPGKWQNGFCLCFNEHKDTFFKNTLYCFLMQVLYSARCRVPREETLSTTSQRKCLTWVSPSSKKACVAQDYEQADHTVYLRAGLSFLVTLSLTMHTAISTGYKSKLQQTKHCSSGACFPCPTSLTCGRCLCLGNTD